MAYTIQVDNFKVSADPAVEGTNKIDVPKNVFRDGNSLNPVPTSVTDVPSTILAFILDRPRNMRFIYGCRMQMNVTMTTTLRLNINGVDVSPNIFVGKETSSGITQNSLCRVARVSLPAGTNVIKLTAAASVANNSVVISPFLDGTIVEDL